MLHGINNLRNNYSMAHPTETLLNEADARFAINLVRSIMTYVDELL
ncbi:TPA: abortive infection family protein [Escherichia coli]